MKEYDHTKDEIIEAIGLNPEEVTADAASLLIEGEVNSKYIERLENRFSKRELALLAGMFVHEVLKKESNPLEELDATIKIVKLEKSALPEGFIEYLESKANETQEQDSLLKGEGGDC
jgi:hypothetical protein